MHVAGLQQGFIEVMTVIIRMSASRMPERYLNVIAVYCVRATNDFCCAAYHARRFYS